MLQLRLAALAKGCRVLVASSALTRSERTAGLRKVMVDFYVQLQEMEILNYPEQFEVIPGAWCHPSWTS